MITTVLAFDTFRKPEEGFLKGLSPFDPVKNEKGKKSDI